MGGPNDVSSKFNDAPPVGGGGGPSERDCRKRLRRPAFLAGFLRKVTLKSAHFSMCIGTNESLYCQLILEYHRNVFFLPILYNPRPSTLDS